MAQVKAAMDCIRWTGNEIMESFPDLEVWDKPDFEYGLKPKDPYDRNCRKEHGVIGIKDFKKQMIFPLIRRI